MSLLDSLSQISTKLQKLINNPLSRFSYTQEAYDNDIAEGVNVYNYDAEQNIPVNSASVLEINQTVIEKGLRSQASSITRNLVNHFFGRTSYNLNKLVDTVKSLITALSTSVGQPNGLATLGDDGKLSESQVKTSVKNAVKNALVMTSANVNADTNLYALQNSAGALYNTGVNNKPRYGVLPTEYGGTGANIEGVFDWENKLLTFVQNEDFDFDSVDADDDGHQRLKLTTLEHTEYNKDCLVYLNADSKANLITTPTSVQGGTPYFDMYNRLTVGTLPAYFGGTKNNFDDTEITNPEGYTYPVLMNSAFLRIDFENSGSGGGMRISQVKLPYKYGKLTRNTALGIANNLYLRNYRADGAAYTVSELRAIPSFGHRKSIETGIEQEIALCDSFLLRNVFPYSLKNLYNDNTIADMRANVPNEWDLTSYGYLEKLMNTKINGIRCSFTKAGSTLDFNLPYSILNYAAITHRQYMRSDVSAQNTRASVDALKFDMLIGKRVYILMINRTFVGVVTLYKGSTSANLTVKLNCIATGTIASEVKAEISGKIYYQYTSGSYVTVRIAGKNILLFSEPLTDYNNLTSIESSSSDYPYIKDVEKVPYEYFTFTGWTALGSSDVTVQMPPA